MFSSVLSLPQTHTLIDIPHHLALLPDPPYGAITGTTSNLREHPRLRLMSRNAHVDPPQAGHPPYHACQNHCADGVVEEVFFASKVRIIVLARTAPVADHHTQNRWDLHRYEPEVDLGCVCARAARRSPTFTISTRHPFPAFPFIPTPRTARTIKTRPHTSEVTLCALSPV